MAITVLRTPSNPCPNLNLVEFEFQASDGGAGVYTSVVILVVGANEITLNYTLDTNRKFVVRLNDLLKSFTPIAFLNGIGNGDAQDLQTSNFITYRIIVKIYLDGGLVDGVGIDGQAYDETFNSVRAGLDYTKFITSTWADELLGGRYASVLPIKRTITRDEYFCICPYSPAGTGAAFYYRLYDSAGNDMGGEARAGGSDTYLGGIITTWNSMVRNESWAFVNVNDVYSFEVYCIEDEDTLSQTISPRYYLKDKNSLFPLRSFLFMNSMGGYDVLTFSGEKTSITEQEKEEANIYYPANYLIGQPQTKEYNQRRNDTYKINSGHISTAEWLAAYQDFIHSEDIYEMVDIGDWDAALPIKLNKSKFKLGQDNQTNQSLDIEYSYRFENFGFTNLLKV